MAGFTSGSAPLPFAPNVRAILGPTNTGKTHLAIERLLAHSSGIIGFPLRLLARENYDRMVARKGAKYVALITGEEKIVPPEARWFSCTVEAMPLDRAVEFLAVDEIQLCADPDRGHVFTDRLLHARGLVETMFLGAETIRKLLQKLVPHAIVETRPRLSQLTHAGPVKLVKLPPRSAVVAFSAGEVYAIAEAIRRRRGGCAVVMGRLSPRTRNAQVALYQEKEVDFLVATDAIGMGLNMDVDHVAFARLSKFDGHRPRPLTPAEMGQIAGRAGRGMRDGTFGTTATCPPLPEAMVAQIEAHSFEALGQLAWRNSDLDFSGVDALLQSLAAPPPGPGLTRGNDSSDQETLAALAREPEMRRLAAGGRGMVRLLWEACQIPDFRKLADDTHTRLCGRVFTHLAQRQRVPSEWLGGQIAALDRTEGDIDTLMQRLSGIRAWSYIAARNDWMDDAATWQEAARGVEDRLSDALHQRLIARFVDRRAAHLVRRLAETEGQELLSAVTRRGEVVVEGHSVGHVSGFTFLPDPLAEGEERKLVLRAARRALRFEMAQRVGRVEAAADGEFSLDEAHRLHWDGAPIARLLRGATKLRPRVDVLTGEFVDGAARERIRVRLQRFVDAGIREDLGPLFTAAGYASQEGAIRGPVHRLSEALGVVLGAADDSIGGVVRGRLKALGIRSGRYALFLPALLKPKAMLMRARLLSIWDGVRLPALPDGGLVAIPADTAWPPGMAEALGWLDAGPVRVRLDVAERVAGELAWATRRGASALPAGLAGRFAVKAELLPAVLRRLGFRLAPASVLPADAYGPPAPAMLLPPRRRRLVAEQENAPAAPAGLGPFAALAALKR
jgi:ATP-dependent RNA helicase SUPV3L1/SUV3